VSLLFYSNYAVVQLLLQHNPHAAMGRRGVGRLPLHYAVFTDKPRLEVRGTAQLVVVRVSRYVSIIVALLC
jgi:hypothetical protein